MKYAVKPQSIEGCRCDDCRAGNHLYALHRWRDNEWQFVAISLQSYASAEECQQQHWWGIQFEPWDAWENGTPIVKPKPAGQKARPANTGERVELDRSVFVKSAEALERHWLPTAQMDIRKRHS